MSEYCGEGLPRLTELFFYSTQVCIQLLLGEYSSLIGTAIVMKKKKHYQALFPRLLYIVKNIHN